MSPELGKATFVLSLDAKGFSRDFKAAEAEANTRTAAIAKGLNKVDTNFKDLGHSASGFKNDASRALGDSERSVKTFGGEVERLKTRLGNARTEAERTGKSLAFDIARGGGAIIHGIGAALSFVGSAGGIALRGIESIGSSFTGMFKEGGKLAGLIPALSGGISKLGGAFGGMIGPIGSVVGSFATLPGLIIILSPLIVALGVILVGLVGSLVAAAGAVASLGIAFGATFIPVIAIAVAAVARFKDQSKEAGTAANKLATAIGITKGSAKGFGQVLSQTFGGAADKVFSGLASAINIFKAHVGDLAPAFTKVGSALGTSFERVAHLLTSPFFTKFFEMLGGAAANVIPHLEKAFAGVATILAKIAQAAMPILTHALAGIASWLTKLGSGTGIGTLRSDITGLVGWFNQWWHIVVNVGSGLVGLFRGATSGTHSVLGAITQVTAKFAAWANSVRGQNQVHDFLSKMLPILGKLVVGLAKLIPPVLQFGTAMLPVVTSVIHALTEVGSAVSAVIKWFQKLPAPIRTLIGLAATIASPFGKAKLAIRLVATAVTGIATVASSTGQTVVHALVPIWGKMVSAVTGAISLVKGAFSGLVGFVSGVASTISGVFGKISGVIGKISSIAGKVGGAIGSVLGNAKGGVVSTPTYVVGEEGAAHPEVVIATNPAYRSRNLGLWQQAGAALGVPGFAVGGSPSGASALARAASAGSKKPRAVHTPAKKKLTTVWAPGASGGAGGKTASDYYATAAAELGFSDPVELGDIDRIEAVMADLWQQYTNMQTFADRTQESPFTRTVTDAQGNSTTLPDSGLIGQRVGELDSFTAFITGKINPEMAALQSRMQDAVRELQQKMQEVTDKLEKIAKEIARLEAENNSDHADLTELGKADLQDRDQIKTTQRAKSNISPKDKKGRNAADASIRKMQDRIAARQKTRTRLQGNISRRDGRLSSLNGDVSTLVGVHKRFSDDLDAENASLYTTTGNNSIKQGIFDRDQKLWEIGDERANFTTDANGNWTISPSSSFFPPPSTPSSGSAGSATGTGTSNLEALLAQQIQLSQQTALLQGVDDSTLTNFLQEIGKGTLPQYAEGTSYVPTTGPAILHQGEAVIPAHLNNGSSGTAPSIVISMSAELAALNPHIEAVIDGKKAEIAQSVNATLGRSTRLSLQVPGGRTLA